MANDRDTPFHREAMVRSLHNGVKRLWHYAKGPDVPPLPLPFDEARSLAIVRLMLEELMEKKAPRDNIEDMARTEQNKHTADFYRRVVDRKDGRTVRAHRPKFPSPFDEAVILRSIIGVALTTTPDQLIIEFNRAAYAGRLALEAARRSGDVEDIALGYEMEWYEEIMDRFGVTQRFVAQAKKGAH